MQKLESIVLPHVETCFRVVKWLQCLKKGINNLFQSLVNLDELRTAVLLFITLLVLMGIFQSQKRTLLLGSTLRLVFSVASQPSSKSSEDSVVNLRKLSTPFIDFSTTLLVLSVGVRSKSSCSHLRQYWSPPPFHPSPPRSYWWQESSAIILAIMWTVRPTSSKIQGVPRELTKTIGLLLGLESNL